MKKRILFGLFGIITTSIIIKGCHIAQGLLLNDWSGVHPAYRIAQLPLLIFISTALGLIIFSIFHLSSLRPITKSSSFFKAGLVLGTIGLGNLAQPWIPRVPHLEAIVISFVFFAGLAVFVCLANQEQKNKVTKLSAEGN